MTRELSFSKGDFIDLQGKVDDNWLEGSIDTRHGMFPVNYVKVSQSYIIFAFILKKILLQLLSLAEYEELTSPKPPTPTVRAVALFDYEGQSDRELTFNKVRSHALHMLTPEKTRLRIRVGSCGPSRIPSPEAQLY